MVGLIEELEQLSTNAETDTIDQVFRHLARKLHRDNKESADPDRVQFIVEADRTLSDPESRAGYDVKSQDYRNTFVLVLKFKAAAPCVSDASFQWLKRPVQ